MRSLAKAGMTMLVVTHEMDFARDISNRVWYMDQGGIYEDGTPKEIFLAPQKPKTQSFIFNIHSLQYQVKGPNFDHVEMFSKIENFCFRHAINKKTANRLQLLAEELLINIITPMYGACHLTLNFSEKLNTYELFVSYGKSFSNALDQAGDDLSVMMVRNSAKEIRHEFREGKNMLEFYV